MHPMFRSPIGKHLASAAARAETQPLGPDHSSDGTGLMGRLRGWRLRRRKNTELEAMSDRELADIGFGRDHLLALLRSRTTNGTLDRMLMRLGLEHHPYLTDKAYRRTLERSCAICPATGACRRWMSRAGLAGGYRRFCPNAFEFDVMARATARQSSHGATSLSR